jgi:hypothetical protein
VERAVRRRDPDAEDLERLQYRHGQRLVDPDPVADGGPVRVGIEPRQFVHTPPTVIHRIKLVRQ